MAFVALTAASVTAAPMTGASAAGSATRTYTADADFAEGTSNNIANTVPGQLQLDDTVTAFPFIWVSLSARGSIAKIDTVTGQIKGEYSTTSDGDAAHNTSRTTVGNDGSVWAGNRNQSSLVHVGLVEGDQCVDRNGNGTIETSTGYGNVLAWPGGTYGASAPIGAAQDECIVHYVDTFGGDVRHLSINGDGDVWAGNYVGSPHRFQLIDDATGAILRSDDMPCGGYGGLVDGNGVLWSAQSGQMLLRWDPNAPVVAGVNPKCIGLPAYGLAFDSQNNIWVSTLNGSGLVYKVTADGNTWQQFSMGHPYAQGLVVDSNDHVWITSSLAGGANQITHLKNDGGLVGQVTGAGIGSTGVSVDAAGKIWAVNINSSDATRIDPTLGALGPDGVTRVGAFDLTVPLPGASPYNYSDMTGSTLTGKPKSGTWTMVYDSGTAGAEWGSLAWTAVVPGDGTLAFTAASSNDGVTFGPAQAATDGADLTVVDGRYLRITATFTRAATGESPILQDVTVKTGNESIGIEKHDDSGDLLDGAAFSLWADDNDGEPQLGDADVLVGSCTTGATGPGTCLFADLEPGDFWVAETAAPPGYVFDAEDLRLVSLGEGEDLVLDDFVNFAIRYRLSLSPDGTDLVDTNQVFTAHLEQSGDGGDSWEDAGGQSLTFVHAGPGAVTNINGSIGAMSCVTSVTGECTVTLRSSDAGTSTLTVSFAGLSGGSTVDSVSGIETWLNPVIPITTPSTTPTPTPTPTPTTNPITLPAAVSPNALLATPAPGVPLAVEGELPRTGAGILHEVLLALLLMGAGVTLRPLGRRSADLTGS